ncbi:SusD/RagB family nutrient-binding outer membrane lipoprotein [Alistipes sp.]|uniref:SusD/RagB family nutrient-binding outer membrane lipoprotein n=1 Tax=Alistipes sp. TaxID=1872444 RepID=UPI0025BCAF07|nr:SusD/RagB family nutrient-binding outer membrane lipoprotein [Alistipes sp.]
MKRYNPILGSFAALALAACTGDFDSFNTNPDAAQTIDKKTYITTMQMDAVIPCSDVGANAFQRACNLMGDAFGGYLSPIQAFNGGSYTCTYDLDGTDYNNVPFSVAFTNVMPAWLNLKYAYANKQITDDTFAVAEVLKVLSLQRTTDIYGPLPVSHFGEPNNPYESQKDIYTNLFKDLNAAIEVLKTYTSNAGNARPLEKVDLIYQGEYAKWLKLANSEKLRMAMRIRFVEPQLAKQYAEEAVRDGVIENVEDNALLKSHGSIQVYNPLEEVWNAYKDTRMGATIDAYMNGYEDPRLAAFFKPCKDGQYHGVRSGLNAMLTADYQALSVPNVAKDTPVVWLLASEVAFLRAEGAMLGWNMGGNDETFYKQGVRLSFVENGLSADAANSYMDSGKQPAAFKDASAATTKYDAQQPSTVTAQWNAGDSPELKLERIITQKWIAMFPNGQEAWSEFRRTGYPRVIPIVNNMSGGKVSTSTQVRRMTFPRSEYANNLAGVTEAIGLLGGMDSGNTKLWWDKK